MSHNKTTLINLYINELIYSLSSIRNTLRNGVWPTSIQNLTIISSVIWILMLNEPKMLQSITSRLWSLSDLLYISKGFPRLLQAGIVSVLVGILSFVVIMYIRQCLLRILLSYRGWMCKYHLYISIY